MRHFYYVFKLLISGEKSNSWLKLPNEHTDKQEVGKSHEAKKQKIDNQRYPRYP